MRDFAAVAALTTAVMAFEPRSRSLMTSEPFTLGSEAPHSRMLLKSTTAFFSSFASSTKPFKADSPPDAQGLPILDHFEGLLTNNMFDDTTV